MRLPSTTAQNLYWLSQRAQGRGDIVERLRTLESNESLTSSEMDALQLEKLVHNLQHAYDTVPYWRQTMDERGFRPARLSSLNDLSQLPLLKRPDLLENSESLKSTDISVEAATWNHSSGSTGVRARFLQDRNFRMWMRAHQLRTYQWCSGWKLGDPFALLWGSEIYWSLRSVKDRVDNALSNRREFNSFLLDPETLETFVRKLSKFGPRLISSYTSAIMLIADICSARDIAIPGLSAIQATSEPMTPEVRSRIRSAFDCEVYDKYGSRETNIVSHEAPGHDGMLIQSENVVVEILNEAGFPTAPGEVGRVVLTTLNNRAMPLIRYETSDLAMFPVGPTHVGPFRTMSSVAGRLQDLISVPGGGSLDSYFFSYLLMQISEIQWFQVVQNVPDRLHIRYFARGPLSYSARERIIERIIHHSRFPFGIEFEELERMPVSPTGKFRLCVNNLS